MTMVQDRAVAMRERALRGEPEPGIYICARCGRDDCRMYTVLIGEAEQLRSMGLLNALDQYMSKLPGRDMEGRLVCPCCSFDGCPHIRPWNCPRCGKPAEPAGSLPGGGPFSRCAFDGKHPVAAVAP